MIDTRLYLAILAMAIASTSYSKILLHRDAPVCPAIYPEYFATVPPLAKLRCTHYSNACKGGDYADSRADGTAQGNAVLENLLAFVLTATTSVLTFLILDRFYSQCDFGRDDVQRCWQAAKAYGMNSKLKLPAARFFRAKILTRARQVGGKCLRVLSVVRLRSSNLKTHFQRVYRDVVWSLHQHQRRLRGAFTHAITKGGSFKARVCAGIQKVSVWLRKFGRAWSKSLMDVKTERSEFMLICIRGCSHSYSQISGACSWRLEGAMACLNQWLEIAHRKTRDYVLPLWQHGLDEMNRVRILMRVKWARLNMSLARAYRDELPLYIEDLWQKSLRWTRWIHGAATRSGSYAANGLFITPMMNADISILALARKAFEGPVVGERSQKTSDGPSDSESHQQSEHRPAHVIQGLDGPQRVAETAGDRRSDMENASAPIVKDDAAIRQSPAQCEQERTTHATPCEPTDHDPIGERTLVDIRVRSLSNRKAERAEVVRDSSLGEDHCVQDKEVDQPANDNGTAPTVESCLANPPSPAKVGPWEAAHREDENETIVVSDDNDQDTIAAQEGGDKNLLDYFNHAGTDHGLRSSIHAPKTSFLTYRESVHNGHAFADDSDSDEEYDLEDDSTFPIILPENLHSIRFQPHLKKRVMKGLLKTQSRQRETSVLREADSVAGDLDGGQLHYGKRI